MLQLRPAAATFTLLPIRRVCSDDRSSGVNKSIALSSDLPDVIRDPVVR